MKRTVTILLTLLLLATLLVLPVSANGPAPYPTFTVEMENYPPEACYIDLLIELSPEDADYADNRENFPDDSWGGSQIFSYEENGYMSYTFHYRGADSNIKINNGRVKFFERSEENLKRFQSVSIAVLDDQGYVLQVSEPFDPEKVYPCAESKVFGIGVESYTVGSAEWCLKYADSREDCISLMDNGHYHPTEVVSDKISAVLAFVFCLKNGSGQLRIYL